MYTRDEENKTYLARLEDVRNKMSSICNLIEFIEMEDKDMSEVNEKWLEKFIKQAKISVNVLCMKDQFKVD